MSIYPGKGRRWSGMNREPGWELCAQTLRKGKRAPVGTLQTTRYISVDALQSRRGGWTSVTTPRVAWLRGVVWVWILNLKKGWCVWWCQEEGRHCRLERTFKNIFIYLVSLSLWLQCMGSRVAEGSGAHRLSSCGALACLPLGMWDPSSPNRDHTQVSSIGRWILNHWTTREVLKELSHRGVGGSFLWQNPLLSRGHGTQRECGEDLTVWGLQVPK